MRAVDTNVLVRLITRDEPRQVASAEEFIANGVWVSQIALAEAAWVLESFYELKPAAIATALEMLLNHEHLTLQDADAVSAALKQFRDRPSLGFTDCLMVEVARKSGHLPLGTFDRGLARLDGTQKL